MPTVQTHKGTPVVLRPPRPSDKGYICSQWVQSVWWADRSKGKSPRSKAYWGNLVDSVLDHPSCQLLVAADPANDDRCLGFLAWFNVPSLRALAFVLVDRHHRGQGIGKALFSQAMPNERPIAYFMKGPDLKHLLKLNKAATYVSVEEFVKPVKESA